MQITNIKGVLVYHDNNETATRKFITFFYGKKIFLNFFAPAPKVN